MKAGRTLKNVFTVGLFTVFSRVLGLVREMLQSRCIGAGVEQSAFVLAFAIPNMTRKLFGEGALTAAFVPIFKDEVENKGVEKAARLARSVLTMAMLMLASMVAIGFVILLVTHSALPRTPRNVTTITLVAILLPYMLGICGAAFGMGVLNSLERFKASSFMPALLNVVWIAALVILLFFPSLSIAARVYWVAGAILCGGFLQMGFMFRCMAKVGVVPLPRFSGWKDPKVRQVWTNMGIGALGAGAVQINYALDQVLAQVAAPWAAGVIGYAERLMDLPLGVIGVAFGTVLLPTFSGHFARKDALGAKRALRRSILQILALMIPASIVTFFCAEWIVHLIYHGGKFDTEATVRVARALSVYGLGLAFFGIQKCLIPFFHAQRDMKTPLRVAVQTVFLNATLNVLAVWLLPVEWRHVGLAASTSLCALVGVLLLFNRLRFVR